MSLGAHRLRELAALGALSAALGCASAPAPAPPTPATPGAAAGDAVVWQVARPAGLAQAALELRLVETGGEGESFSALDVDGSTLQLAITPVVTSRDLARVEVAIELDLEHYAVTLHFTPQAAQRLAELTSHRLGGRLAVLVDGQVLFAPYIQGVLSDSAMIANRFDRAAATRLAERLAP